MRLVGALLAATLVAGLLPSAALGQSPSVLASPSASPIASSVPWRPALDASGAPLAAGGPVTPVAILGGDMAVVAAVVDATGTTRIWATPDGDTWAATDPATFGRRRIDGLAVTGGRWLAWSQPVPADGADLAMWTSRATDPATWTPVPADALDPFQRANLATITGGANGFIAVGTRRVAGTPEARLWTSEFGASWRERPQFAAAYPGARSTGQAPMGRTLIATGTDRAGRPAVWVGWSWTSYVWRKTPASLPRGVEPLTIVAGRDAGLMVGRRSAGTTALLRSIDAWTWEPTDGPPGFDPSLERTAWAGSPTWIVADTVDSDGAHDLQASVDGLTWTALPATGLPTDGAVPLLAIATDTVVALTPAGIWARPIGLEPPPPAAGTGTRFDGDAPGADSPLRPPVTARWKDRERLVVSGPPDAVNTKDGVTLELWLPDRAFRPGEWLPAHIRFTNRGPDTIIVGCDPGGASGNLRGFWPSGRTWTGNAAIFKRRVLKANAWESVWFRPARPGSLPCPGGDVGLDYEIAPGESHTLDLFALPASRIGDQPLPSGRMPVRAALSWRSAAGDDRRRIIAAVGSVRLIGPAWRWPSPGRLVDAALEDPFFGDWIARQAPPREWSNTTFTTSQHWIYTQPVGYEGAAPDGTVHLGLFAGSWSPVVGGYGQVLLDPWTGTVLGSGAEE